MDFEFDCIFRVVAVSRLPLSLSLSLSLHTHTRMYIRKNTRPHASYVLLLSDFFVGASPHGTSLPLPSRLLWTLFC